MNVDGLVIKVVIQLISDLIVIIVGIVLLIYRNKIWGTNSGSVVRTIAVHSILYATIVFTGFFIWKSYLFLKIYIDTYKELNTILVSIGLMCLPLYWALPKKLKGIALVVSIVASTTLLINYPNSVYEQQAPLREQYILEGSPRPTQVGEMLDLMNEYQEQIYIYEGQGHPNYMRGSLLRNYNTGGLEFLPTQGIALRVFVENYNECNGEFTNIHFMVFHRSQEGWFTVTDLRVTDLIFGKKDGKALFYIEDRVLEADFNYVGANDCTDGSLDIYIK